MSSTTPQENAARKDTGPRDPEATTTAPERPRGRKRSHPSDAMDDSAPPNVKLPTAVSITFSEKLFSHEAKQSSRTKYYCDQSTNFIEAYPQRVSVQDTASIFSEHPLHNSVAC